MAWRSHRHTLPRKLLTVAMRQSCERQNELAAEAWAVTMVAALGQEIQMLAGVDPQSIRLQDPGKGLD